MTRSAASVLILLLFTTQTYAQTRNQTALDRAMTAFNRHNRCVAAYGDSDAKTDILKEAGEDLRSLEIAIGSQATEWVPGLQLRVYVTKYVPGDELTHHESEIFYAYISAMIHESLYENELAHKGDGIMVLNTAYRDGDRTENRPRVTGGFWVDPTKISKEKFRQLMASLLGQQLRLRERLAL